MSVLKSQLQSKKLMFAMILFIASIIFVATNQADFSQWAEFVKWVFGIYAAGNVGEHVSTKGVNIGQ
jgi:hypothetical protein|tara:strand:+ start:1009 stop:1209 length:201 start_codon:yes stop_codon:yes gene_type:complete